MTSILDKRFRIKDSIDIYIDDRVEERTKIQFYKINTREKISITADRQVTEVLRCLSGVAPVQEELNELGYTFDEVEAINLLTFLAQKNVIEEITETTPPINNYLIDRYLRQINFFDNFFDQVTGYEAQKTLLKTKLTIIGAGAVGSNIATQLTRAGLGAIQIIDPKELSEGSIERHSFATRLNIGVPKVTALKEHLEQINPEIHITTSRSLLTPTTNLDALIDEDTDLVINTADEPYIGHTSTKLGRYLWPKQLPLYVAGGFDAHHMSTGEFIIPGLTPCIDCCSNTFREALKDWKPTYASDQTSTKSRSKPIAENSFQSIGGSYAQSLFSSSHASISIIAFIVKRKKILPKLSKRGEYLINHGTMTWFAMQKNEKCNVCGIL